VIGLASLKQSGKVMEEVGKTLSRVPLFVNGIVTSTSGSGVGADSDGGRLMLDPGTYLVLLTTQVEWKHAFSVTVAVVVGADTRFQGPRAVVEGEHAAEVIIHSLPPKTVDWDHTAAGQATAFGVIVIPAGEPAPVEVYAMAETRSATHITFRRAELVAVKLAHHIPEANS
jgi:hypothetical protein